MRRGRQSETLFCPKAASSQNRDGESFYSLAHTCTHPPKSAQGGSVYQDCVCVWLSVQVCKCVFVGALSLSLSGRGEALEPVKNGVNFFSYGRGERSLHGNREKEPRGGTPEQHHPRPSLITHTQAHAVHTKTNTHTDNIHIHAP